MQQYEEENANQHEAGTPTDWMGRSVDYSPDIDDRGQGRQHIQGGSVRRFTPAMLEGVIEEGRDFLSASVCLLLLYDDARRLRQTWVSGLSPDQARQFEDLSNRSPLSEYFARLTSPVLSASSMNGLSPLADWVSGAELTRIALSPVCVNGRSRGILVFGQGEKDPGSLTDERAVQMVANVAALALSDGAKKPEQELTPASKDRFLSALSHELRTPLTSIIGFTQIIRKRLSNAPEKDERLLGQVDVLWAQAQRLNRLIDTFVDVSRLENGDFSIDPGKVEIISILKRATEQTLAQSRSRHKVVYDLPDHEVEVYADLRRLDQVFSQVVSNAVRFSPENEPILISCEDLIGEGQVVVSVTDKGPGIPSARTREVFERFQDREPLRGGGLGVGLFVSRSIIEAHGGTISMDSVPHKGTTIRITLPK